MFARSSDTPVHGVAQGPVRVVAAAVRGTAHAREGVPCQDAWAYAVEGDRVCAVVCDGAGSAAAGRSGALVGSAILVEALRRANLRGVPSTPAARATWRRVTGDGIARARRVLRRLARARGDTGIAAFHATLVGVAASPEGGCFFHIGDGAGVAGSPEDVPQACVLSPPANGRYLDETYFFTESSWAINLRLTPFGPSPVILLMSDGPAAFVLNGAQDGVDAGFCTALIRHFERRSPEVAAADLAETLDAPAVRRICDDDKSLIVVRLSTAS